MSKFVTRTYNNFKVNNDVGTLTKLSGDAKLSDEIEYYKVIGSNPKLSKFFPRIFESGKTIDGTNYIEIEYVDYKNLAEQILFSEIDGCKWTKIIKQLTYILSEFRKIQINDAEYDDACEKMYVKKTLTEYEKFSCSNKIFEVLTSYDSLTLNGKKYKNFKLIKNDIFKLVTEKLCSKKTMNVVHGDFCFGNIISSVNDVKDITSIKLIDPRGSWGKLGIYGDCRYDIAKLYHSFDGCYEYLTNNLYKLESNGNVFELSFHNDNTSGGVVIDAPKPEVSGPSFEIMGFVQKSNTPNVNILSGPTLFSGTAKKVESFTTIYARPSKSGWFEVSEDGTTTLGYVPNGTLRKL